MRVGHQEQYYIINLTSDENLHHLAIMFLCSCTDLSSCFLLCTNIINKLLAMSKQVGVS